MSTRQLVPSKPTVATLPSFASVRNGLLERKCACGGTHGPSGECEDCRKKRLQRKPAQHSTLDQQPSEIPPIVHEVVRSLGRPLDPQVRRFMEPRFRHDLSQVCFHTDARTAESASAVNALAYTVGHNLVFGENTYDPSTHAGRELIAHELAHTTQQTNADGASPSFGSNEIFESSADVAARTVANGEVVSRDLPTCGVQIQCAPAKDARWKNDVRAARYRGQLMANRIRKHGKLSFEARAKINKELAYFEGAAKETYLEEVKPILRATVEIEMPEEPARKKIAPPPPITLSPLPPDPRLKTDEELEPAVSETQKEEQKEREQEIEKEKEKLRQKTSRWSKEDQEFALSLLAPFLDNTHVYPTAIDPRAISDRIRQPIVDRYRHWLEEADRKLEKVCQEMNKVGGVMGFILKTQAGAHPQLDPCRRWFADEYSHGPSELRDLERHLRINRGAGTLTPAEYVYYDVFEYRKKTDPLMLEQAEQASSMVSGLVGAGRVPEAPAAATQIPRAQASCIPYAPGHPLAQTQPGVAFEKTQPGAPPPYRTPTQVSQPPSGGEGGGGGGGARSPSETIVASPPPMPQRPPPPRPVIPWFPRRNGTPMGPQEVQQVIAIDPTRIIWSFNRGNNMAEWTAAGGKGLPPLAFTSGSNVRVDYQRWTAMGLPVPKPVIKD